jgi:plastocyanin
MRRALVVLILTGIAVGALAQDEHQHHHNMQVSPTGVVMNENVDVLPRDCASISRDHEVTIRAGRKYAEAPGMIFGMSEHEVRVQPCSRITVTFINEDDIRHQWMVHGLPKYLYPAGMFHVEASGGQTRKGTFIVPAEHRNYLIHCDIAQHMEKGMRGQLVVGKGSGDLWNVAEISSDFIRAHYAPASRPLIVITAVFCGFLLTSLLIARR